MTLLEKVLEEKVVAYAAGLGYVHFKLNALGSRGKPDHLFVSPRGTVLFIEFKRQGERPSALQQYWARQLLARKQLVYGCEWYEHAKIILENHLDPTAVSVAGVATYDATGFSWAIPRSGAWEDLNLPYGIQDLKRKRNRQ